MAERFGTLTLTALEATLQFEDLIMCEFENVLRSKEAGAEALEATVRINQFVD